MQRALWSLQSAEANAGTGAPIRWDAVNAELIAAGAPPLGDNNHGHDTSYEAFSARWDDPQEGPILKQFVDRFDGQGIVPKTGNDEAQPEQGGEQTGEVEKMAKRATKLGK